MVYQPYLRHAGTCTELTTPSSTAVTLVEGTYREGSTVTGTKISSSALTSYVTVSWHWSVK